MTRAAPQKLLDYLTLAHEHLNAKGIEGARLDAELLLAHALGLSRVELYTNYDRPLKKEEIDRFRELLRRRAMREPLAYVVGRREFWSLDLEVDRRVLIPRPETETLVEATLGFLVTAGNGASVADGPGAGNGAGPRLLDLGTGSGAIAVALAVEVPALRVVATDIAAAALEVAPRNAAKHGVAERIEFRQGDLYAAVRTGERFDLIVSNPPYCRRGEVAGLQPEIREWEPAGALASGVEGMDVTRRIVEHAPEYLAPEGWLVLEVGMQGENVRELLSERGWRDSRCFEDLAGRLRVIAACRPAE